MPKTTSHPYSDGRIYTYIGRKAFAQDSYAEGSFRETHCRAVALGAVGDCVRAKGHDGFHQSATGDAFTIDPAPEPVEMTVLDVEVGDIVLTDGMRVRVDTMRTFVRDGRDMVAASGPVVNWHELRPLFSGPTRWTVQGNARRTVTVERS